MHQHHHEQSQTKNISIAFFLNAFFVIIEVIGGLLTNSIAILSDALHDFGDCLSLGVAWGLQKKSSQKRDASYSYGYKRFSLLGSVFLSGILTISSFFVIKESIIRVLHPQEVHAQGMLWIAIFGIIINGAAAFRLNKGESLNERAVYLHIMEDVLGWIAVLIASIVMMFVDFPILDSLLSILISIWVLYNVYHNLKSTFKIFLQAVPENLQINELQAEILKIDGINSIHDLHIWSLDGESHVMTLHIVSDSNQKKEIREAIYKVSKPFHIEHITMDFERLGEECNHSCERLEVLKK